MSALKVDQLLILSEKLKQYGLGTQLQEIALTENYLLLQHYGKGDFTIGIELKPLEPQLGYYFGALPKRKYLIKPIILFLKAHARNLRLSEVIVDSTLGRVVRLIYGINERKCTIELRLIPHGMNIVIETEDKIISLFPAKVLPPSMTSTLLPSGEEFNLENYLDEWTQRLLNPKSTPPKNKTSTPQEDQEKKRKKEIEKKLVLLGKLELDYQAMNKPWNQLGEYLKIKQSLEVPEDWLPLLDPSLPVNSNMQRCFEKHKNQERRKEQNQERVSYINNEIEELKRNNDPSQNSLSRAVKSSASELLGKAKAKGRKLQLAEGIEAVFGKSAKDNMALLRKAQAWDLWLHLRDLPGAHLIVRRPRSKNVDHHLLLEAGRWLLNETIGKKRVIDGDRYDLIMTECRHVKPIKGDRLGRVHFQNETTLTLRV